MAASGLALVSSPPRKRAWDGHLPFPLCDVGGSRTGRSSQARLGALRVEWQGACGRAAHSHDTVTQRPGQVRAAWGRAQRKEEGPVSACVWPLLSCSLRFGSWEGLCQRSLLLTVGAPASASASWGLTGDAGSQARPTPAGSEPPVGFCVSPSPRAAPHTQWSPSPAGSFCRN